MLAVPPILTKYGSLFRTVRAFSAAALLLTVKVPSTSTPDASWQDAVSGGCSEVFFLTAHLPGFHHPGFSRRCNAVSTPPLPRLFIVKFYNTIPIRSSVVNHNYTFSAAGFLSLRFQSKFKSTGPAEEGPIYAGLPSGASPRMPGPPDPRPSLAKLLPRLDNYNPAPLRRSVRAASRRWALW